MIDKNTEIVFNEQIAERTFLMGLKAPEIASNALPGQFVMIRVGPALEPLLRRPFSICGTLQGEILLILYKVVGRGTALMSEASKGDGMMILGPLGKGFSKPPAKSRPILVAGGIGIAPLLFLAQTLKERDTIFLAGYRSASEIVPFEKMDLTEAHVVTATDDGSAGHHGFVTDLLKTHLHPEPESSSEVYACGPTPMLKKVAALTTVGSTPCQMSLEAYMACGLGACQGCAVKSSNPEELTYHLVCRDGPIFTVRSIDWEAL